MWIILSGLILKPLSGMNFQIKPISKLSSLEILTHFHIIQFSNVGRIQIKPIFNLGLFQTKPNILVSILILSTTHYHQQKMEALKNGVIKQNIQNWQKTQNYFIDKPEDPL